jgi:WD40 repeat protein
MIVWEYPSGKKLWARDLEGGWYSLPPPEFSPNGKSLVIGGLKCGVVFDVTNGKSATFRELWARGRVGFKFSPDSKFIACNMGAVGIWSLEKQRLVAKLTDGAEEGPAEAVFGRHPGFSRDGRFFVSAESRIIRVWELPKLD